MRLYIAMNVQSWDFTQEPTDPMQVSVNIHVPEGCRGYLPVYDSLEALRVIFPDAEYQVITVGTVSGKK